MFSAYTDTRPDPDGPVDVRVYGVQEYVDWGELLELVQASFGITFEDPAT